MQDAAQGGLECRASQAGLPSIEDPSVPPPCMVRVPTVDGASERWVGWSWN